MPVGDGSGSGASKPGQTSAIFGCLGIDDIRSGTRERSRDIVSKRGHGRTVCSLPLARLAMMMAPLAGTAAKLSSGNQRLYLARIEHFDHATPVAQQGAVGIRPWHRADQDCRRAARYPGRRRSWNAGHRGEHAQGRGSGSRHRGIRWTAADAERKDVHQGNVVVQIGGGHAADQHPIDRQHIERRRCGAEAALQGRAGTYLGARHVSSFLVVEPRRPRCSNYKRRLVGCLAHAAVKPDYRAVDPSRRIKILFGGNHNSLLDEMRAELQAILSDLELAVRSGRCAWYCSMLLILKDWALPTSRINACLRAGVLEGNYENGKEFDNNLRMIRLKPTSQAQCLYHLSISTTILPALRCPLLSFKGLSASYTPK